MSRDNPYFRFNLWNLTGKTSCFLYKVVNEKGIHRVDEKRQSRQEEEKEGGRRRRRRRSRWLAPPPPARLTGGCLEQCQWVVKAPRVGRLLLLQGGQGGQGGALRAGSLAALTKWSQGMKLQLEDNLTFQPNQGQLARHQLWFSQKSLELFFTHHQSS